MSSKDKFTIQENQYSFPYHYLVDVKKQSLSINLYWGVEYYLYVKKIIEYVSMFEFNNYLDVGCGDGRLISILSDDYPENKFVGYDLSEPAILMAKGINYHKKNCRFECNDFSTDSGMYDLVSLVEVLEHVPDNAMSAFIQNINSRLKGNGKVIISVPSINIFPVKDKHYRHYDVDKINSDFHDFNIVKIEYVVKNNRLFNAICRLSKIWPNIDFMNRTLFYLSEKSIYAANACNCRHLLCVLEKKLLK